MRFKVIHNTEYQFSNDVFFEPHYLRLKPRNTSFLELKSFNLEIAPNPAGISEQADPENNFIHFCWFNNTHNKMEIRLQFEVESKDFNPFNFLIHPIKYSEVPFKYSPDLEKILKPSLKRKKLDEPVIEYGNEILKKSEQKTINFLANLTQAIHLDFKLEIRLIGKPYHPNELFRLKNGSCRDLAWMQIQILRNLGFASRFVSGYYYFDAENPEFELHAWLEVFIPGAGWIGLDPSHGMLAGNAHIPVASSANYQNTMPVSGSVRGDATSELKNDLNIEIVK